MSRHSRRRFRHGHGWRLGARAWRRSPRPAALRWVTVAIAAAAVLFVLTVIVVCIQSMSREIAPAPGFAVAETIPTANQVVLPASTLSDSAVKFYRYVPAAGRETRFFVVRTSDGVVRSAFDACDQCFRDRRGFRQQGDHLICNSCGRTTLLRDVDVVRGACNPVPLEHSVDHDRVTVAAAALQSGGRYF